MKKLTLLFDADDTLLDYRFSETHAIVALQKKYMLTGYNDFVQRFKDINGKIWKDFELGEITQQEILWKRFEILNNSYGITNLDSHIMGEDYKQILATQVKMISGARRTLKYLSAKHDLYCITNGISTTQNKRFKKARINKYFKQVFVSEEIGFRKPQREFFSHVMNTIQQSDKDYIYVVGDSLSADILGGANCGLKTIWFNLDQVVNTTNIVPNFEVNSHKQLRKLVDRESQKL